MDYIELSTVLNFPACGTRQCVNVGIVNDLMDEPEEEFGISLEKTPDLNSGILLDPVNGKIFIEDNGKYTVLESWATLQCSLYFMCALQTNSIFDNSKLKSSGLSLTLPCTVHAPIINASIHILHICSFYHSWCNITGILYPTCPHIKQFKTHKCCISIKTYQNVRV